MLGMGMCEILQEILITQYIWVKMANIPAPGPQVFFRANFWNFLIFACSLNGSVICYIHQRRGSVWKVVVSIVWDHSKLKYFAPKKNILKFAIKFTI